MQLLHLIRPTESEIPFTTATFPDGQPHVRIDEMAVQKDACLIYTRLSTPSDFLLLALAVDALRRAKVRYLHLKISYLLGARMDRVMQHGEPLSVQVFADLINMLNFEDIAVFDPHSDVTAAVLKNCRAIPNTQLVRRSVEHWQQNSNEAITLVSPDAGAMKKVAKVAEQLNITDVVVCSKSRSLTDGKLSNFKVNAEHLEGKTCMIVDDICDGGATFTGVAQELKNKGAGRVLLTVSHGIFSKGFELNHVDAIYSSDSYQTFDNVPPHVTLFNIEQLW